MADSAAARRLFYVVASVVVERGYPSDPLSLAREAITFTTHRAETEAIARLFTELDADLAEGSAMALRRSYLIKASIPEMMLADGCPRRWVADRAERLLASVGGRPGEFRKAVQRGTVQALLEQELDAALSALSAALHDGPGQEPGGISALAMRAAGASLRAQHNGAVSDALAGRIATVTQDIGTAAWEGQDASHLAPALDALLPEVVPLVLPGAMPSNALGAGAAAADYYGFAGLVASMPPLDWSTLDNAPEPV